ncbi:hypothetical protein GF312_13025 [Candidatus Poribacteria bacterium]|nr:hypothetical protein [Candidatus Poribacteria bacterium]
MSNKNILVKIKAGSVNRANELVYIDAKPKSWFENWHEGDSIMQVSKADENGNPVEDISCQFDSSNRKLYWLSGDIKSGNSALFSIALMESKADSVKKFNIQQKPAHLMINVDDELFARYNYLGVWKPYFWPVNGPSGNVVRGAGGADHPHHTGLYMSYGGHGEGGSANIWSDWDEPPYGPCGKMLHQRFVSFSEGPVYAGFVEETIYVKGNGDIILNETRTARIWFANNNKRFMDLSFETTYPEDIGERQFMLVARINPSMNIPKEGHVENSESQIGRSEIHHQKARWCDFSGKVGHGINGISIFDHPDNPEHPGFWGEIAVPSQMTLLHHPPDELTQGRFRLKYRVYLHDGLTGDANIENWYQNYVSQIETEIIR